MKRLFFCVMILCAWSSFVHTAAALRSEEDVVGSRIEIKQNDGNQSITPMYGLLVVSCFNPKPSIADVGGPYDLEEIIVLCQQAWEEAFRNAAPELEAQQLFAGYCLYDGIGMLTEKDRQAVDLLLDCSSSEDVKAVLNEGFIDWSVPGCGMMEDALERCREILEMNGYSMPLCHYIQHSDRGFYGKEEGWNCFLGEITDDLENPCRIMYQLYLSGEDMRLLEFTIK